MEERRLGVRNVPSWKTTKGSRDDVRLRDRNCFNGQLSVLVAAMKIGGGCL